MSDGIRHRTGIAESLALNGKFFALCFWTVITSVGVYSFSHTMPTSDETFIQAILLYLAGLYSMLLWGAMLSPYIIPTMLIGWSASWVLGGLLRLPSLARVLISAGIMGGSAVLPLIIVFGGGDSEGPWEILLLPLLLIVPPSAIFVALIVYRERQETPNVDRPKKKDLTPPSHPS